MILNAFREVQEVFALGDLQLGVAMYFLPVNNFQSVIFNGSLHSALFWSYCSGSAGTRVVWVVLGKAHTAVIHDFFLHITVKMNHSVICGLFLEYIKRYFIASQQHS